MPILIEEHVKYRPISMPLSPSFPHVFGGNPGQFGLDPRLIHSGMTLFNAPTVWQLKPATVLSEVEVSKI